MAYDQKRVGAIVQRHQANHPYLEETMASRIIGWVMSNRDKRVNAMTDVERALKEFGVSVVQMTGYRFAGAEYFNQLNHVDRRGKLIPRKR